MIANKKISTIIIIGFASILFISVLVLGVSIWELNKIATEEERITSLRTPTVHSSMQMEISIAEALAALRGWMLLGDPAFKVIRQEAWRNIDKELVTLKQLSKSWTTLENIARLHSIANKLNVFRQYQGEIEAIAQSKENIPAILLFDKAAPRAADMMKQITLMIDVEKNMVVSHARKKLLLSMADLLGSVGFSLAHIRAYLLSGDEVFHHQFNASMKRNENYFKLLSSFDEHFTAEQHKAFIFLIKIRSEFVPLTKKMIRLRGKEDWNIANHLLKTKAVPIGLYLHKTLQDMVEKQNSLLYNDSEAIQANIAQFHQLLWGLLVLAIFSAIIVAMFITRRITQPIHKAVILAKQISMANFSSVAQSTVQSGTKETDDLLTSLRTMAVKLDDVMQKLQVANEAQVKAIVDAAYDSIVTINGQGIIELVNPATLRIFGYDQESELVGKNITLLMTETDMNSHEKALAVYSSEKESVVVGPGLEVIGQKKNGETVDIFLSVSELQTESGKRLFCGMIRDLTNEKNRQRQLIHADKLASIGTLATGIAHELRQPLFVMQGNAEEEVIDGIDGFNANTAFTTLEQVVKNCERMNGIINHLRTFAREGGEEEVTDIRFVDAIESAFTLMGKQFKNSGIEVEMKISDKQLLVHANISRIEQVIINLLNNARDILKGHKAPKVIITVAQRQNQLACIIADNGSGIPDGAQNKVFDPFFTTKDIGEGTGLGLSISHGIINDYNGSINVCNPPSGGAEFTILLPISKTL